MAIIILSVKHEPIAQPRQRFSARGGFARAYVDKKHPVNFYKRAVREETTGMDIMLGPLKVTIWCYFQRPKGHFKTKKGAVTDVLKPSAPKFRTNTPDNDNLAKSVLDALNPDPPGKGDYPGLYPDDKNIVDLIVHKRFACQKNPVGTIIVLEVVTEQEDMSYML
tara:strand:+ start:4041 stop:4535 length:495 start_codon:yes stop_codon:yes gene_type:complete